MAAPFTTLKIQIAYLNSPTPIDPTIHANNPLFRRLAVVYGFNRWFNPCNRLNRCFWFFRKKNRRFFPTLLLALRLPQSKVSFFSIYLHLHLLFLNPFPAFLANSPLSFPWLPHASRILSPETLTYISTIPVTPSPRSFYPFYLRSTLNIGLPNLQQKSHSRPGDNYNVPHRQPGRLLARSVDGLPFLRGFVKITRWHGSARVF